ncbi:RNA 2',3'-cyclic phosphodiesterase [Candidatus Woesearchaeota archaeon]|nr:MAG: RNA 2',3'-cyclic phosphodiesterase [Candidatus Woesearchaeota archaeon]
MRLFIACPVSLDVVAECKRVQSGLSGARFSFVKDFHVTLKFLGEVAPKIAEQVVVALGKVHFSAFDASLSCLGVFPSMESPRVVWLGVEPAAEFISLQRQVDDVLSSLFPKEKEFVPHLTIARVKEGVPKLPNSPVVPQSWHISRFVLYESVLTKEGSQYRVVAEFPLRQAEPL